MTMYTALVSDVMSGCLLCHRIMSPHVTWYWSLVTLIPQVKVFLLSNYTSPDYKHTIVFPFPPFFILYDLNDLLLLHNTNAQFERI